MEKLVDIGSERAVLAGIMTYGNQAYVEVDELCNPHTFTQDSNQIIYKCFQHFFLMAAEGDRPDIASVYASSKAIGHDGFFDNVDEKKYLRSISNFPVNLESIRKLAGRLRKLEFARQLYNEAVLVQQAVGSITGDESIAKILSLAEDPLSNFADKFGLDADDSVSHIGEGIDEYLEYLFDNPRECVGISTGFPQFDECIGGGLRRGSVNIIGARPKIGKTTLGINVSLHITGGLDIPVFYFDMEMDKQDFWVKMLANLACIDVSRIEKGKVTDEEKIKLREAKEAIKGLKLYYVNIAGKSYEETWALAKRIILKKAGRNPETGLVNDCVLIYDYFRLNNSESVTGNIQEYQALGFQIIALKNFAKKMDIPVLSFIQLNRDGIDKEDTDVASGSDRIIWLCNNFSIFKPKGEDENEEDLHTGRTAAERKIVPVVSRHGAGLTKGDYINVFFDGKFAKLTEGKTRSQVHKSNTGFAKMESNEKVNF